MEAKIKTLIKNDTLCNNNLQVKFYLNNMKKRLKKLDITDKEMLDLINDSLETLRIMKKMGQKLENRLRKYHDACISLGFKRVRRNK